MNLKPLHHKKKKWERRYADKGDLWNKKDLRDILDVLKSHVDFI